MDDFKIGDTIFFIEKGYDGELDYIIERVIKKFKDKKYSESKIYAIYETTLSNDSKYNDFIALDECFKTAKEAICSLEEQLIKEISEHILNQKKIFSLE